MSRIAKSPIPIPSSVQVKINGANVWVKGKLGELSLECPEPISVREEASTLVVIDNAFEALKVRLGDKADPKSAEPAKAGLVRALVNNMIVGVTDGFECKLELRGVGYRAKSSEGTLELSVGFSHPVKMKMPKGVSVDCPKPTEIVLTGADKQEVFQVGANIRAIRPPEPYKGKGIRYVNERVRMKEVKKK
jgi:large subunit ribosomal protein L6